MDRKAEGKLVEKVTSIWSAIGPVFGAMSPEDLTKKMCRDYARDRTALGRKPHTVHGELRVLRTILNWSGKAKLIKEVPYVWLPPMPPPRDRHLTRDGVSKLLDAADLPHVRLFIIMALTTASRRTALLELTWDRVDFDCGLIYLHDPKKGRTNKGRAIVPMNDTARAALLEAKTGAVSNFVIEWAGGPIKSVPRALDRCLTKAGLKVPHDGSHLLRHTSAVLMAEAGIPMAEIAQYLGHSNTLVTARTYAR